MEDVGKLKEENLKLKQEIRYYMVINNIRFLTYKIRSLPTIKFIKDIITKSKRVFYVFYTMLTGCVFIDKLDYFINFHQNYFYLIAHHGSIMKGRKTAVFFNGFRVLEKFVKIPI